LTFGEITVAEGDLTNFIGRDTKIPGADTIGIDSALDFALEGNLNAVVKHADASKPTPPTLLSSMYQERKAAERTVITTHGEASGFFVTFIDNHDRKQRFLFQDPQQHDKWSNQLTLALGVLFGLQGIPCVYYGTEQGMHGIGDSDGAVREAVWGKTPKAFDRDNPFCGKLRELAKVRAEQPAMRYGRQYFRQLSGDQHDFAVSTFTPGVISFSRILNSQEVVVVANTSDRFPFQGEVIVDLSVNHENDSFRVLFSNLSTPRTPGRLRLAKQGSISVSELDGTTGIGPALVLPVDVQPLEVQILRH